MTNCNACPVIITRPLAQAVSLAQRVTSSGRTALVFPLLEIQPLSDTTALRTVLNDVERYAMVMFVSPNAIEAAFSIIRKWPAQVMIAVVGEGSRAALAQHGITSANTKIISPLDPHRTDSETLLAALDLEALQGKRVLIVRGETGRELLADALLAHDIEVERVTAYKRVAPALTAENRKKLQHLLDCDGEWVITSSEALRNLMRMVEQVAHDAGVVKMQRQKIIVPHLRIAETARALGFVNITQTGSGDEQLLATLQCRA